MFALRKLYLRHLPFWMFDLLEVWSLEVWSSEVCSLEVWSSEVWSSDVCSLEVCSSEVLPSDVWPSHYYFEDKKSNLNTKMIGYRWWEPIWLPNFKWCNKVQLHHYMHASPNVNNPKLTSPNSPNFNIPKLVFTQLKHSKVHFTLDNLPNFNILEINSPKSPNSNILKFTSPSTHNSSILLARFT